MKLNLNLLLIVGVMSGGCATQSSKDFFNNRRCHFYGASFCIGTFGEGAYISNGPDFVIYNIHFNKSNVLAIYEGDHAQEFGLEKTIRKRVGSVVVAYREFDDGETLHRYYYNPQIERPHMLHMMSPNKLSDRQAQFVDAVLESLRYCRPSGASMICDETR